MKITKHGSMQSMSHPVVAYKSFPIGNPFIAARNFTSAIVIHYCIIELTACNKQQHAVSPQERVRNCLIKY